MFRQLAAKVGLPKLTGSTFKAGGKRSVAIFGPAAALAQKALADQMASLRAGIDTYNASARFVEIWGDTVNWTKGNAAWQVSGGKMYAGPVQGGGSNGNRAFAVAATDPLRWSVSFMLPAAAGTGSVIIGFDNNAPGVAPSNGASSVSFGLEFNLTQATGIRRYLNGVVGGLFGYPGGGNYSVHYIGDANWLSYAIFNDDTGTESYYGRVLRSTIVTNNLFLFNADSRQLAGASINACSARAALQPGIAGGASNAGRFSQYTASDAAGTVNYHIWGPAGYDPRTPVPLAILFHGDGGDEHSFLAAGVLPLKEALVAAGFLVVAGGIAGNKSTWGGPSSIDAYVSLYQYVSARYTIGPVVMLAQSMGGIESLNVLASKRIPGVVAWAGYSPTANLARAYATTWTAKINASYGITGIGQATYALCTDGYDPLLQTDPHAFQDVPMMFVAATDDALVPRQFNTEALKAKVAATAAEVIDVPGVTGGHGFDLTPYCPQIIAFLNRYAKP
ncbi:alpha/beta hydrolase [Duganella aceris]|uniref:Alpha/beta hydrolase n=1 Tax=Duganella aceris TaxID=2703883 RepID=A0ABX0FPL9_9BURK|nr:alpha/beta hydrolase [Duganella aceris]NGZ86417.1 alpha/beta hydrolase [Duganella aceris]